MEEDPWRRRFRALLRHFDLPLSEQVAALGFPSRCSSSSSSSSSSSVGGPVVIGAMVLDIHATPNPTQILQPATTTPGKVRYVRGGVGRNVAECMCNLGMKPFLISVVGKDMAGDDLLTHWRSLNLATDGILQCSDVSTPVVSAIFDQKGELAGAVADTQAIETYLTPEWISKFAGHIRRANFLVLDANLSPYALEAASMLAKSADVPIWFEPVSVSKSVRHKTISRHLTYVSPNEAELIAMSMGTDYNLNGILNQSDHDNDLHSFIHQLEPCVFELLQQGIAYVVLTLGKHGVILCSKKPCHINNKEEKTGGSSNACYYHFPALKATTIVSLSGAGDCFVAGALTGLCLYKDLWSSIAFGIAVANRAIQSELNVPSSLRLTQEDLSADAQSVLASMKQLKFDGV